MWGVCMDAQISKLASKQICAHRLAAFLPAYVFPDSKELAVQFGVGGQTCAYNPGSLYFTNLFLWRLQNVAQASPPLASLL